MAIQHFYPETERRFYECLICKEAIYNPLCQECLGKHMIAWLKPMPSLNKKISLKIRKFMEKIHDESDEALTCASCNKKQASVCPYCFTEFVIGQLKKAKAGKEAITRFINTFNFDYDSQGYTKEAAEEGLF